MKTKTTTNSPVQVKTAGTMLMSLLLGLWMQTSQAQTTQAQSAPRTVTGIVQTPNGPLPYAAITLKGTQVGIQADENGAFTFPKQLNENDTLIISSLAYEEQEFTIKGNTSFIQPYLEGTEIIIVGALRTAPTNRSKSHD